MTITETRITETPAQAGGTTNPAAATHTPAFLVVDGAALAQAGRGVPSLAQMEKAVGTLAMLYPGTAMSVIVDAAFPHRLANAERAAYEAAMLDHRVVCPPAGAVGSARGMMQAVAARSGGTVVSTHPVVDGGFPQLTAVALDGGGWGFLWGGRPVGTSPRAGFAAPAKAEVSASARRRARRNRALVAPSATQAA